MKKIAQLILLAATMMASGSSFAYGYYGGYHHGFYGPRVGVVIGGWGPPPIYYAPPPVVYAPPPVVYVTPPAPRTYIEKTPQYSYYCQRPTGYYPQVARCPSGWMKVVAP